MRLCRAILVVFLLAFSATVALADTIPPDPRIIILGATGSTSVLGLNFSFQANNQGLGTFFFVNNSNQDWLRLDILTVPPSPCSTITGSSDVFANFSCASIPNSGGQVLMSFFGVGTFFVGEFSQTFPGILNGTEFAIGLGTNLAEAWTPNESFSARANVPEPATLALFLTGVGILAVRRRFRKALHSRV